MSTFPHEDPERTLEEARQWLRERVYVGAHCPCCKQLARVTRFRINGGMAMLLMKMKYWEDDPKFMDRWINVNQEFKKIQVNINAYNFYKLKHWGVVESKLLMEDADEGSGSGYWRLTELGRRFCLKQESIATHVFYYNDTLIKRSEDSRVMVQDVLGTKFSYSGLMAGYPHAHLPLPQDLQGATNGSENSL